MSDEKTEIAEAVIRVENLRKSYGETQALKGVGFSVRAGEVFGYLGPNGAGKTTTINILCGLTRRDEGRLEVCGLDVERDPVAVKELIGVVPEESNLYPELTCRRNLEYLGELYGLGRTERRKRAEELLATFDLVEKADALFRKLSRGMKRRLTLAAALIHRPKIVFLDEPTAGLDVPSARALRSLIREMNRNGTTVFLTTHNLAEAESLCDRVLILVGGRAVAEGTAVEIRRRVEKTKTLSVAFSGEVDAEVLKKECPAVGAVSFRNGNWLLEIADTHAALLQIAAFAESRGLRIAEITSRTGSFEDTFLALLEKNSDARQEQKGK